MAFGGFDDRGEARPMAEINTTPLVDVMLVLLVIFIITAPLLTHAIRLDLPDVDSKPSVETPTTVTVSIAPDGALYWNNDAIGDLASLKLRLAAAAGTRPRPEIQLRADRETRYQRLAEVVSIIQQSGLGQVGLITRPAAPPGATER